jgi:hypothetical protein
VRFDQSIKCASISRSCALRSVERVDQLHPAVDHVSVDESDVDGNQTFGKFFEKLYFADSVWKAVPHFFVVFLNFFPPSDKKVYEGFLERHY